MKVTYYNSSVKIGSFPGDLMTIGDTLHFISNNVKEHCHIHFGKNATIQFGGPEDDNIIEVTRFMKIDNIECYTRNIIHFIQSLGLYK